MHDGMQYDPVQGQKLEWKQTDGRTDHRLLNAVGKNEKSSDVLVRSDRMKNNSSLKLTRRQLTLNENMSFGYFIVKNTVKKRRRYQCNILLSP